MRIELLGPSGAGKTTILDAATEIRGDQAWLGPADIAPMIKREPTPDRLRRSIDTPEIRGLVDWCIRFVAGTAALPSWKVAALTLLRQSSFDSEQVSRLALDVPIVHDELLLHRSSSLLPHSSNIRADTQAYFELVPTPEAAVIVTANRENILERIRARPSLPNIYVGLSDQELRTVVANSIEMCDVAAEVLRRRGVRVFVLDADDDAYTNAKLLDRSIRESAVPPAPANIRDRLLLASGSFRKKDGRHELRRQGVMYCAFSTPGFTIAPGESQRDAAKRVAHFGLDDEVVAGKTILDLGSNAGAMLFQLSNHGPAACLGIEYDADKVEIANEIATIADIRGVRFEQGDIDHLDADALGVFDIVLALAIEAHVQDPSRLYDLLGKVTGDILCFEGNNRCDMDEVHRRLAAVGFTDFTDLGFCDDDIDPGNNNRPQLLARKSRSRFAKLGSRLRRA